MEKQGNSNNPNNSINTSMALNNSKFNNNNKMFQAVSYLVGCKYIIIKLNFI